MGRSSSLIWPDALRVEWTEEAAQSACAPRVLGSLPYGVPVSRGREGAGL